MKLESYVLGVWELEAAELDELEAAELEELDELEELLELEELEELEEVDELGVSELTGEEDEEDELPPETQPNSPAARAIDAINDRIFFFMCFCSLSPLLLYLHLGLSFVYGLIEFRSDLRRVGRFVIEDAGEDAAAIIPHFRGSREIGGV